MSLQPADIQKLDDPLSLLFLVSETTRKSSESRPSKIPVIGGVSAREAADIFVVGTRSVDDGGAAQATRQAASECLSFPKTHRSLILSIRTFEAVWFMPEMIALPAV